MTNSNLPRATSAASPAGARGKQRAGPRWLRPQSLAGVIALAVAGDLLWQPLAVGILLPLLRETTLTTWAHWRVFLGFVVLLGACSGMLWWLSEQRPAGWSRYWLRSTARVLAIVTTLDARYLTGMHPAGWCLLVLVTAAIVGFLFSPLERWNGPRESQRPAA